jgi:hypothetical protein
VLYTVARFLQFAGLVILPLAITGNIADRLSLRDSLLLSGFGVVVFYIGYSLQQGSRPRG